MKKFSAKNLQDAIYQAASELNCSVVDLEYEIIQQSSNGFLGIGKKDAVIIANKKNATDSVNVEKKVKKKVETIDIDTQCKIIEEEIRTLLSYMPYEIDTIRVTPYDKQTLMIFLDGADSALLIGEKGYRYKALSYLLFNWIQPKYGYNIRLEVAKFLQMQEEIVEQYVQSIKDDVETAQSFKTKSLNGILGVIVLKRLRDMYPGRYICLKQEGNEQYILISSFE